MPEKEPKPRKSWAIKPVMGTEDFFLRRNDLERYKLLSPLEAIEDLKKKVDLFGGTLNEDGLNDYIELEEITLENWRKEHEEVKTKKVIEGTK